MSSFSSHNSAVWKIIQWNHPTKGSIEIPCNKEGGSVGVVPGGIDTGDAVTDVHGKTGFPQGKVVPAEVTLKLVDSMESQQIFLQYMNEQVGELYMAAVRAGREDEGYAYELTMRNARVKNPGSVKFGMDITNSVDITITCGPSDMKSTSNITL